ncbi:P-loop NTPase fold protein [Clostridium sp. 'White wine YQ']|uniref:P-loop NTPase fold protein n=1 Tax=Clostridium sp. 'White wine YQ' TaxID=3027474 RepID=UPI0023673C13|nr:P-loop NTPase fold protein [Clostridium sp. 'White wine YQ']MDD7795905.1 P-loop NTPase fold protein [Clostridium sp. 'White wine YQ']
MALNRKYSVNALKKEEIHLANYSSRILNKRKKLNEIIGQYIQGIHVISGMRGVGKTTFINLFKDKYINNRTFIHLNVLDSSFDLISEIIIHIDSLINDGGLKNAERCREKINRLKYKIFNEVLIKRSFESKITEKETNKLKRIFGINIKKYIDINLSNNLTIEEDKKNEIIYEVISTPIQKQEKNIKELISILKELSNDNGIVIILDEIDKLSDNEFDILLDKNKELFLESGLVYFMVCDTKKYINIRYDKKYMNIFNRFIYLPLLSWEEYLVISPKIKEFNNIESVKKSYCYTLGNYRRIITFEENDEFYKYSNSIWNIINETEASNIYKNSPEPLKDILKEFLFDIFNILKISTYLTDKEINNIKDKHTFISNINIIIDRIIELLKTSKYIDYINGRYILKEDDKELYYVKSDTLENEILKIYKPKEFRVMDRNRYRIEELSTSEMGDLLDIITWHRTELDAVLIFRQEVTYETINNISYHAVILTNNNLCSTAFVNVSGFSWNHECIASYSDMKKYLSDRNIVYKEYELRIDETVKEAFENKQHIYMRDLYVMWQN